MVACTLCQSPSLVGTLFCPECGARLSSRPVADRQFIRLDLAQTAAMRAGTVREAESGSPAAADHPTSKPGTTDFPIQLALRVARQEIRLALASSTELTLGRVDSQSQAVLPDIDLNPHGGYELGVSRIHASLQREKSQLLVTDLGSANGTYVNGRRLEPYSPCPVNHGDHLQFGSLDTLVYYLPSAPSNMGQPGGEFSSTPSDVRSESWR